MFYPELTSSLPCGEGRLHLDAGAPPGHMPNPAGLYAMLGDALYLYYAYSGDVEALGTSSSSRGHIPGPALAQCHPDRAEG